MAEGDSYGCKTYFLISVEGILFLLQFVLGLIAFVLVLSHELSSIFSHYGFFIVVSGLCWIGAFLIILFHMCGCCKVNILGVWQKEYSLWIFLLSYSLSYFFFFLFSSALLSQWTEKEPEFIIAAICGFILAIVFFILCVMYYKRVRKIRLTEVLWEGDKSVRA
ncbi:uncharacterized protein LOC110052666 [Orbicella faveolata]|uniref:uncharacterized protein LOC110052666 n=1 Tax=Orbicella faveolata TaxID=48498 RepID=UPI0009E52907|nr:uncharacterized protein LOC110052666 [Orbicella faveolata]XP_020614472.1 uncharacterized protein LOC110052666 [Orbicella faveolata]